MHALRDLHAALPENALSLDTSMSTTMGLLQAGEPLALCDFDMILLLTMAVLPGTSDNISDDLPVRSSNDCFLLPAPGSCLSTEARQPNSITTQQCLSTSRWPTPKLPDRTGRSCLARTTMIRVRAPRAVACSSDYTLLSLVVIPIGS